MGSFGVFSALGECYMTSDLRSSAFPIKTSYYFVFATDTERRRKQNTLYFIDPTYDANHCKVFVCFYGVWVEVLAYESHGRIKLANTPKLVSWLRLEVGPLDRFVQTSSVVRFGSSTLLINYPNRDITQT